MMINRRLIHTVKESKQYVAGNVAFQWVSLMANVALLGAICSLFERVINNQEATAKTLWITLAIGGGAVIVRFCASIGAGKMSYLSSKAVKRTLREAIYQKLLRLGLSYREGVQTSEVVQVAVEGVDQLEIYFGQYLPQFFYAMLAPLTLFVVLATIHLPSALILLLCVPLIPISIAAVQTWAKKLLGKYWGQYTALGDTFLENLQGLTTLKIYQSDGFKHQEMNESSERFRKITMKVLSMQLNSITIMDLVAYGGAAAGMIAAILGYARGALHLGSCLFILLIAADFFIPMRLLGSFFHVAMNGMAASDKIFRLLDLPEKERGTQSPPEWGGLDCQAVWFSYEPERPILRDVTLHIPQGSFTALVGESGCGKSTVASLLMGRNQPNRGAVTLGGIGLEQLKEEELMDYITYINHQSYLFQGTVREHLEMGRPQATEEEMWQVLEQVRLAPFLQREQGLDTKILERGSNFSGGQCQRLALARALLHDSPVYLFDEATSNVDVESENDIMELIHQLAKKKTVVLISHRLANVVQADCIYVMKEGQVVESGLHSELLQQQGHYAKLWGEQQMLECYGGGSIA